MSAHLPTRRIALSAPSTLSSLAASSPSSRRLLPLSQRRTKWSLPSLFGRGRRASDPSNRASGGHDLDDPKVRQRLLAEQQEQKPPSLSDSIFQDEVEAATADTLGPSSTAAATEAAGRRHATPAEAAAWRLDPDPRSRVRWERKKVIQMVQRQTADKELSEYERRVERIARTERQMTHKSPFLETSTKKLVMLARQIQGKTLQDALLQMTYSKKKMAREVKFHLEEARDFAVVSRGMGIPTPAGQTPAAPVKVKTKDGQSLKITDPSSMYVAQAWVNKGPSRNRRIEFKGRGRTGVIISPSTGISVILKEEKTRIREHNERVAKEAKRKPWVHLPNRPVTAQRPYYSW